MKRLHLRFAARNERAHACAIRVGHGARARSPTDDRSGRRSYGDGVFQTIIAGSEAHRGRGAASLAQVITATGPAGYTTVVV
jgi:hypothetical protein